MSGKAGYEGLGFERGKWRSRLDLLRFNAIDVL